MARPTSPGCGSSNRALRSADAASRQTKRAWCEPGPFFIGPPPSLRRQADGAVQPDDLAIEHVVGDDLVHELGVVLRPAQAAREGHAGRQRVLHLLGHAEQHRRAEDARRDRHVADAVAGQVARDRQGHADDAALGGRIGRLANLAVVGRDRGGRDQHAALTGGLGLVLGHGLGGQTDHVEAANQVDRDRLREAGQRMGTVLADGLDRGCDARAVHEAHQLAQARGGGHGRLAVGLLADIALDEQPAQLGGDGLAAFDLQIGDDHLGPVLGQHAGRAFAEARGAAGDDEHLACNFHDEDLLGLIDVNVNCGRQKSRGPSHRGCSSRRCDGSAGQGSQGALRDVVHRPQALDAPVLGRIGVATGGPLRVVIDQRARLRGIDVEALADRGFLVIGALDQVLAGFVILALDLGRIELDVVGTTRRRVRAAAAHAFDDGIEGHVDFEHVIELDAGGLHGIGLRDGARETVEQETVGAIGLGNAFLDQGNDQVVADQGTGLHHRIGLETQRGAGLDGCTQHVAGGDLRNAESLADEGGLGAFAGARGAQKNQSHGSPFGVGTMNTSRLNSAVQYRMWPFEGLTSQGLGKPWISLRTRSKSSGVSTPGPGRCSLT
mmetsp:Transcript_6315/g.25625  ORF Transcript_6315/g.25625 Transcript_6315/m.25625 type:complete len:609 (+) Transcript_6315:468-2294(+)